MPATMLIAQIDKASSAIAFGCWVREATRAVEGLVICYCIYFAHQLECGDHRLHDKHCVSVP